MTRGKPKSSVSDGDFEKSFGRTLIALVLVLELKALKLLKIKSLGLLWEDLDPNNKYRSLKLLSLKT